MRRNYRYFIFLAVLCLCAVGNAAVQNGGFEDTEPNDQLPFDPPEAWIRENHASVRTWFTPDPCEGDVDEWKINLNDGIYPIEGQSFVVVSSGDFVPEPWMANIQQYVWVQSGQTFSGYYFFGTADYLPYNDYATIKLVPYDSNSGLRDIIVVRIDVSDVNDNSCMEGWDYFERTFSPAEAGGYELMISVRDMEDQIYPSYLIVDGLTLCNTPPDGDISRDCQVNFIDFALLADDWLVDCSDPNYISDPNYNCYKGTNLNGLGRVDANDLELLSDNWLYEE